MKGNVLRSLALVAAVAAVMSIILVFTAAADAKGLGGKPGPDLNWAKKVPDFQQNLEEVGFNVHEVGFGYMDFVKLACTGVLPSALANNPWPNAYMVLTDTHLLEDPNDVRMHDPRGTRYDKNFWWQLREDEAMVLVGETPPEVRYFSFSTYAYFLPDDPLTSGVDEAQEPRGIEVGDTLNLATIHTIGPDPFLAPIVYVITGHRETEQRVRDAALAAGYPAAIINVQAISPVIAPLGIGPQDTVFALGFRSAVAASQAALTEYIVNANTHMRVFRVTPLNEDGELQVEPVFADDPEPVPVLRPKGTGYTEMELYPALKSLRAAILNRYASLFPGDPGYPYKELDTDIWSIANDRLGICEKPYANLQRGLFAVACTRDNNYLTTGPMFKLRNNVDEFAIVYGVNHQATGKSTYASFSLYDHPMAQIGLGTTVSTKFDLRPDGTGSPGDSARQYLSPDDPYYQYADKLYAWKVARDCGEDEPYCLEVTTEFLNPVGEDYTCPAYLDYENGEDWLFFIFRNYMEPATKVGPDDNELVYDRAIYFGSGDFLGWGDITLP
jgi:hypothetical protein